MVTRTTATYASSGAVTVSVADGTKVAAQTPIENVTTKEVLFVESISSNDLTVNAEGRGYEGTTAAAGSSGDIIHIGGKHKTIDIEAAINVVYNDWLSFFMPRLQWDTTTAGNFSTTANIFAAPAVALEVVRVAYQPTSDIDLEDLTAYKGALKIYPTSLISTGKGFSLSKQGPTDKALWQLVKQPWTFLEAAGDTVPSDFPVQGVDLIVDGAALYLAGWKTLPKTHLSEVAAQRESGENPNLAPLRLSAQEWARRVKQVASQYNALATGASPQRVWIGG